MEDLSDITWLALAIGNSRLHWAQFAGNRLAQTWHTPHLAKADRSAVEGTQTPELWIASVVPEQSDRWRNDPKVRFLSLADVPLKDVYPTLGIDRALAVWGAISTIGAPVLTIDAGTALTFTGADADQRLIGGAILPGLRLQFQALGKETAALPDLSLLPPTACRLSPSSQFQLPSRWARDTEAAIASGILYTLLAGVTAFIADWWRQFPDSAVVVTGGDRDRLYAYLKANDPAIANRLQLEPNLVFQGILAVRNRDLRSLDAETAL